MDKPKNFNSIRSDVHRIFNTAFKVCGYDNPIQFHRILQSSVCRLAKEYGFIGIEEYPVRKYDGYKDGCLDILWVNEDFKQIAVFEIDSAFRKKSILKLMKSDTPFKFWIYYGNRVSYTIPTSITLLREQK